ncbi:ArpU family phage packaging/lysis transcriptional regulator [Paenibacillus sp. MSJ-34]|uniref:ArpU family phage packaging/lysis transcriptional regulator n=1 Tax=Paenibacillus sp. MSJ-34 TaxID=2841529 RepID=UPI001C10EC7F|nr:ArpU family phage packaging/lysis transcriptional regulator [Paenibacillus sp. MSJ-34]MBU5444333.1 transcriptional regulator [Paenibacillus sp. MSJ-34]
MLQPVNIPKLRELDRKRTKAAVEDALEKYRFFKTVTFEIRETAVTASYTERLHGRTNETSDKTADVAVYNVDEPERRKQYCERIERIIERLPHREKLLIQEMVKPDRVYNYVVYNQIFDPPISEYTFYKLKWEAFKMIAFSLNIQVYL